MKFIVQMKDPDVLHDAIDEAVTEEVEKMEGLDPDERQAVIDTRKEKINELCCSKWFEYGEYLRVEIDTEAKTCTVIE